MLRIPKGKRCLDFDEIAQESTVTNMKPNIDVGSTEALRLLQKRVQDESHDSKKIGFVTPRKEKEE